MGSTALLLHDDSTSPEAKRLRAMLDFFGIPCRSLGAELFAAHGIAAMAASGGRCALMASADTLAEACSRTRQAAAQLCGPAASVFVYGWRPTDTCRALLREISGDAKADIRKLDGEALPVSIAEDCEEMCGPMSGLAMELTPGELDTVLAIAPDTPALRSFARAPQGHLFAAGECGATPVFLDASPAPIDIQQRATKPFNVRKNFSGAVAVVMYLKWAFREIWWEVPELNACLTLDDLLLREQHGYFEYSELLRLIDRYGIAATVGFIPWNWRRRESRTVEAIRKNADRLSVCMHGCDHGKNEFAVPSPAWLDARVKAGKQRMSRLSAETGIPHDQVQIFPQGKFCPEVGRALKHNGLTAAVNTEPAPLDHDLNRTTIADQWSVANLRYGDFPIFSRRSIRCGVENFAFDGLLGKPCLIGGHHDLFHNGSEELIAFLEKLQSLKWKLNWRTLENALRRSCKIMESSAGTAVEMYAERLYLENRHNETTQFTILKSMAEVVGFQGVAVNGSRRGYEYAGGKIRFHVTIPPGAHVQVVCEYAGEDSIPAPDPLAYQVRIAVLRHLSVLRDTWISKAGLMNWSTVLAMRIRSQFGE